jgi:hypothetical protein
MYKIPVFSSEIEAGIAEKVVASACVAYCVKPQLIEPSSELIKAIHSIDKTYASIQDKDLYPVRSILASTNWNNNDDIFDRLEVWASRNTPIHKPDNLNHDDNVIVGHMVDAWGMSEDGQTIADDIAIDKLPNFFHLVNDSVIYLSRSNPETLKAVAELIESIKSGDGLVSMECLFRNFDYGLIGPNGEQKVLARTADTAFLTKHLRVYGGQGEFEGYKVGRVLRQFIFSGKGYVTGDHRPANPHSIVFSGENDKRFSSTAEFYPNLQKDGVSIFCKANLQAHKEISDMAEGSNDKVLQEQITELKAAVQNLTAENKTLAEKSTKASVEKLEKTIADLTAQLEESKKLQVAESTAKAELTTQVNDLTSAKARFMDELNELKAQSLKASRIAMLVQAGISTESATATVEKFVALSDDQFKVVADFAIAAFPKKDDKKKDEKPSEKDKEKAAADTKLEDAEVEKDASLATASEGDEETSSSDENRKALASWLESRKATRVK